MTMNMNFQGIWIPIVTPFRDRKIDFPALRNLARGFKDAGVAGLVACGTTGEPAALDDNEQLALLDQVLDAAPGLPVVMGLAGNNLDAVRARLAEIQLRNIAGVLLAAPYYIRPSQAGLCAWFNCIADASSAPLILYNIPYRTGVAMELETIRAIARHPNVMAIKDCGGDPALTMQLIADDRLAVLAGDDMHIFSTLCLGGAGAIAASAHIRPDLFVRLERLARNGNLEQGRQLFYRLLPLIRRLLAEPNPAPLKAALAHLGQIKDELRSPMQAASPEVRAKLLDEIERLGS